MIFTKSQEIPYKNISRINYDKSGIINTMFNVGTINIELTGMALKNIELVFIENVEKVVKYIQDVIAYNKWSSYRRYAENQNLKDIVNQY